MTTAYPLHWPQYKPRTSHASRAPFKTTFEKARTYLTAELNRLGARNRVISTNVPLRNDGFPYADYKKPSDRGVAVYFEYEGKSMCFACDRWDQVEHNLQAIGHTINALRGIARWGTGDMLQAAFTGFTALTGPAARQWWDVLGVDRNAALHIIEGQYKILAMENHPDAGGNADTMAEINAAVREAREARA